MRPVAPVAAAHTAEVLRRAYPRVLATTLAFVRNLPEAEDAVQEAVTRALSSWGTRGVPDAPEAWLTTVAANVHRDRLRKGRWEAPQHDALETLAQMSPWVRIAVGEHEVARGWKDELLRLVFACCHPALPPGESAALCLATIVGMSTREVALAFLVEPRAMEQRLTRARRRLRQRGDPEGTTPDRSRDRLPAVLRVIHLLFNEGYWSSDDAAPIRGELCRLAIGLARSLADEFADRAEVLGLLALLRLHDARREARTVDGEAVPLPEQDRTRWNREAIDEALTLLEDARAMGQPGAMQLEAAISAVHCQAETAEDTDWRRIAALYEQLEALRPTPGVRINRAFAVGRVQGPDAALALLDALDDVDRDPYVHLVRGTLLAEAGRTEAARDSLGRARDRARNASERTQIQARLDALPDPSKR